MVTIGVFSDKLEDLIVPEMLVKKQYISASAPKIYFKKWTEHNELGATPILKYGQSSAASGDKRIPVKGIDEWATCEDYPSVQTLEAGQAKQ